MGYFCNDNNKDQNYWTLKQDFPIKKNDYYSAEKNLFVKNSGFGFVFFNQKLLPSFITDYSSSIIAFYIAVVYVVSQSFRSGFVPKSNNIFIENSVDTSDILMIC